jgi:hypothetical protein
VVWDKLSRWGSRGKRDADQAEHRTIWSRVQDGERDDGATLSIIGTGSPSEDGTTEALPCCYFSPTTASTGSIPQPASYEAQVRMICQAGFRVSLT